MISIIIPTYNYARFLPAAIDSALAQGVAGMEIEILVVDDGSTDDTGSVLTSYGDRVRCICKKNAGLSAARNTGMSEARHDWVVFLDSDDMLAVGAVAALWRVRLQRGDRAAVIAGRDRPVDVGGAFLAAEPHTTASINTIDARSFVLRNRFAPAVLADRRLLLDLGGFDPALNASEDRDMWIRVAAHRDVVLLDQITLLKRDHGGNMSRAAARQTAAIERVLGKAFSNPKLQLSRRDQRLARAICMYQSALMYSDAGSYHQAAARVLWSFILHPWGGLEEADIPAFSRFRGFAGNIRKLLS